MPADAQFAIGSLGMKLLTTDDDQNQCDQIGRFLKFPGGKFSFKNSPNTWLILGILQNTIFELKTTVVTFWATFGKNWATFNCYIWSH